MRLTHSTARRRRALIVLLPMLALLTNGAMALGLGELSVHSRLGSELRAEVLLIEGAGDVRLAEECFRLNRPADGETGIPALTRARLRLERPDGRAKLIVTSGQPITDPAIQINLHAGCGAEVERRYTILLDPVGPQDLAGAAAGPSLPEVKPGQAASTGTPASVPRKILPRRGHGRDESGRSPGAGGVASAAVGRLADRLVLSSEPGEAESGALLSLRLSTELFPQRPGRVSENARAVLRMEYRLLAALHEQAGQQLAIAEQLRNLEAGLEELRAAYTNATQDRGLSSAPVGSSPPAPALTAPIPTGAGTSKEKDDSNGWLEALAVLAIIGVLAAVLRLRARRQSVVPISSAEEEPRHPAKDISRSAQEDPGAAEDEREAIRQARMSGTPPDIVLEDETGQVPEPSDAIQAGMHAAPDDIDGNPDFGTAMELAEIMICFGRIQGAAQTLEDFLAHDPDSALAPWLKLLQIYRTNDMREEFEAYSKKLLKHFNVAPADWEAAGACLGEPIEAVDERDVPIGALLDRLPTLVTMPHVRDGIEKSWGSAEGLTYLRHLLRDTRGGTRGGFPLAVARELQFLVDLLETRLKKSD